MSDEPKHGDLAWFENCVPGGYPYRVTAVYRHNLGWFNVAGTGTPLDPAYLADKPLHLFWRDNQPVPVPHPQGGTLLSQLGDDDLTAHDRAAIEPASGVTGGVGDAAEERPLAAASSGGALDDIEPDILADVLPGGVPGEVGSSEAHNTILADLSNPVRADSLNASDPEPSVGTIVRDNLGTRWWRTPEGYWAQIDADADPESWVKVAGNYGPVVLLAAAPAPTEALGSIVDEAGAECGEVGCDMPPGHDDKGWHAKRGEAAWHVDRDVPDAKWPGMTTAAWEHYRAGRDL